VRKSLWVVFLLACAVTLAVPVVGVPAPPPEEQGQAIFREKCASCHTVGKGRSIGPDLAGVTGRRDRTWLVEMITAPGTLLDSGDPVAGQLRKEYHGLRMPDLGISPEEAEAILAFLAAKGTSVGSATPASPDAGTRKPPPAGNPETGKSLFSGTTRFRNGGAPCLACHEIAGLPGVGGTLGPDLTQAYTDFGEEETSTVLASLPFPTMKPIYESRPLTSEEQGHIKAFLRVSAQREPVGDSRSMLLAGIGGGILALAIIRVAWRKRLAGVRRPLLRRTASPRGGGA